jgi:phosphoketolase
MADLELNVMDAYWRAANYLSVGQIIFMIIPCSGGPTS